MNAMTGRIMLAVLLGLSSATGARAAFVHPGILHTQEDLDRIRRMVRQDRQPWKSGFEPFQAHRQSSSRWRCRGPFAIVNRPGRGNPEMTEDANAAYQNALMYCITGDQAHAKKAVEILNAWSHALKAIKGHDQQLAAGLYGFKFVNAAELIRHAYAGWEPNDIDQARTMFREVLYPVIEDFATFANGNWDAACMKTMLAIGIFCDDQAIFDRAVHYYRQGTGNGAIQHYIVNPTGQCQESGRDQAHTQLGLGLLAECCQVAWNQGIDLYGEADNRLYRGYEYTARYNLGYEVPFAPMTDTTGKYTHRRISPEFRGRFRAIWEIVWNHYHRRKGLEMPYTRQVVERLRPEGAVFGADNAGFGTLLFALPDAPAAVDSR